MEPLLQIFNNITGLRKDEILFESSKMIVKLIVPFIYHQAKIMSLLLKD